MLVDVTNPITNLLFPRRCVACNRDIANDELCLSCRSLVTKASRKNLMLREKRPALFFYEGVIKRLIIQAKFHRSLLHAHVLMQLAQKEIESTLMLNELEEWSPTLITSVPTHWLRRIKRRVDLPLLFAVMLGTQLRVPVSSCLVRRNLFDQQTHRENRLERYRGIDGAFRVTSKNLPQTRLLVVDDIVTTGATFDESKKMLEKTIENVICLALARTP